MAIDQLLGPRQACEAEYREDPSFKSSTLWGEEQPLLLLHYETPAITLLEMGTNSYHKALSYYHRSRKRTPLIFYSGYLYRIFGFRRAGALRIGRFIGTMDYGLAAVMIAPNNVRI